MEKRHSSTVETPNHIPAPQSTPASSSPRAIPNSANTPAFLSTYLQPDEVLQPGQAALHAQTIPCEGYEVSLEHLPVPQFHMRPPNECILGQNFPTNFPIISSPSQASSDEQQNQFQASNMIKVSDPLPCPSSGGINAPLLEERVPQRVVSIPRGYEAMTITPIPMNEERAGSPSTFQFRVPLPITRGRRGRTKGTWKCDTCNGFYSRKDNLRAHQRIHSGEMPYRCSNCGERFRWLRTMQSHQRSGKCACNNGSQQQRPDFGSRSNFNMASRSVSGWSSKSLESGRTLTNTIIEREWTSERRNDPTGQFHVDPPNQQISDVRNIVSGTIPDITDMDNAVCQSSALATNYGGPNIGKQETLSRDSSQCLEDSGYETRGLRNSLVGTNILPVTEERVHITAEHHMDIRREEVTRTSGSEIQLFSAFLPELNDDWAPTAGRRSQPKNV